MGTVSSNHLSDLENSFYILCHRGCRADITINLYGLRWLSTWYLQEDGIHIPQGFPVDIVLFTHYNFFASILHLNRFPSRSKAVHQWWKGTIPRRFKGNSGGYSEKKGDYVKGHRGKEKRKRINTPLGSKN